MTACRFAIGLLAVCWGAIALATDEIQVYNDDIDRPGEAALEMHANLVVDGRSQPDYDFNLGIGRGWRNSDERWVIKLIVGGIPLNKR